MGKEDIIAFDKTGTLTHGEPAVADVMQLVDDMDRDQLLSIAAAAESRSEHPLAKALCNYAEHQGIHPVEVTGFLMQAGKAFAPM